MSRDQVLRAERKETVAEEGHRGIYDFIGDMAGDLWVAEAERRSLEKARLRRKA